MTPRHYLEAHTLLGWTQSRLATAARTTLEMIDRYEREGTIPKTRLGRDWQQSVRSTLDRAGIEFVDENGGGAGVRLRKVDL